MLHHFLLVYFLITKKKKSKKNGYSQLLVLAILLGPTLVLQVPEQPHSPAKPHLPHGAELSHQLAEARREGKAARVCEARLCATLQGLRCELKWGRGGVF